MGFCGRSSLVREKVPQRPLRRLRRSNSEAARGGKMSDLGTDDALGEILGDANAAAIEMIFRN